jgi:hypothetical protein
MYMNGFSFVFIKPFWGAVGGVGNGGVVGRLRLGSFLQKDGRFSKLTFLGIIKEYGFFEDGECDAGGYVGGSPEAAGAA